MQRQGVGPRAASAGLCALWAPGEDWVGLVGFPSWGVEAEMEVLAPPLPGSPRAAIPWHEGWRSSHGIPFYIPVSFRRLWQVLCPLLPLLRVREITAHWKEAPRPLHLTHTFVMSPCVDRSF